MRPTVLVIDDLESARLLLRRYLEPAGYDVIVHSDAREALKSIRAGGVDVVLTDLKMPGMDGMTALEQIRDLDPELPVIMLTAFASIDTAVEAMRLGAFDYLRKPFDPAEVGLLIERALKQRDIQRENVRLKVRLREELQSGIIASSEPMKQVLALAEKAAPTDVTVLIQGDTGTGKERIAQLIHGLSDRSAAPFVTVNCCAIPESLVESELFGVTKGSYTGATSDRSGFVDEAQTGTLLLDEIGDLALPVQPKLLRLLQSGEYYPVGGHRKEQSQARVLCATNQDLGKLSEEGKFRSDLYYRINVMRIELPPLRRRVADIPLLANQFLKESSRRLGVRAAEFDPEVLRFFSTYPWPGNVRQLENVVERSVLVHEGEQIGMCDLPSELLGGKDAAPADSPNDYDSAREQFERSYLTELLDSCGGNVTQAARLAGVHRATFYKWLNRYNLNKGSGQ